MGSVAVFKTADELVEDQIFDMYFYLELPQSGQV